ncbi:FMN-binding negative transcriptional regulator [Marinicauda sp. Alg238-R41]|uniref:FMN-binding negative transcriptional regulator n=1 Tax=Marinicauda sp. Alg238-R41 TaxID=2993447 RepID=UPI0022E49019|nr:FMN-binding negative transcriptional regulator [Marinicauda sp. Alg238-R41]
MFSPHPAYVCDSAEAAAFMRQHRFATLVVQGPDGLIAARTPMLVECGAKGEVRALRGHVARANPICPVLDGTSEGLVLFSGADAYVSPGWYASKAETGRAVPTWNYSSAEARGIVSLETGRDQIISVIDALSDEMEADQNPPWRRTDAPPDYIERLLNAIVAVRVEVREAALVRKLSQDRTQADFTGIADALAGRTNPIARQVAADMNELPRR